MGSNRLPEGYLEFCSIDALESLLLARMNQAANLCAQAKYLLHRWVEVEADAKVARWMLEMRRSQQLRAGESAQGQAVQNLFEPLQSEILAPLRAPACEPSALLPREATGEYVSSAAHEGLLNMPKTRASDCPHPRRVALPVRERRCEGVETGLGEAGARIQQQGDAATCRPAAFGGIREGELRVLRKAQCHGRGN